MMDDLAYDESLEVEEEQEGQEEELLAPEPLFTALLRRTLIERGEEDGVLRDIVEHLATPISVLLAGKSAKGGQFAKEKAAEGKEVTRYSKDQSMRAHLFNGLLPVLQIAKQLKAWGAPQFRRWDGQTERLFVAGYLLHDWGKLPEVDKVLQEAGLKHDANANLHLPFIEEQFSEWMGRLGLMAFLEPIGGGERWLHELIYIAANTQVKWGTMRNLRVLRLKLDRRRLDLVTTLSNLADVLAYSSFTPVEVTRHKRIQTLLCDFSNNTARLTYHHVVENRGILTNLIHNAALDALAGETRVPLLYAPSGVVYLEHIADAPPLPAVGEIAQATIGKTREICILQLRNRLPGFKSSPTGFRFPEFYWLFFDLAEFLKMTARGTLKAIPFSKKSRCGGRFEKALARNFLPSTINVTQLPVNTRVDQLAELLQLWERILSERCPSLKVLDCLFELLAIESFREQFEQIVTGRATGGVAYNWYVAAAVAQAQQTGLSEAEWAVWLEGLARSLSQRVEAEESKDETDGWAHLREYVAQVLSLDGADVQDGDFGAEFTQYLTAKKKGRGTTNVCSLCAASNSIEKQQESALLFAPSIYSNRLMLHGGKTQRHICAICSQEMMLRQLLMNHTQASGKNFEARKVRYLFFYPSYFFTPLTLDMMRDLYERLKRVSITALRKVVLGKDGEESNVRLDPDSLQRLQDLLLAPKPADEQDYDRFTRLHYPKGEPLTFSFVGIPAGRDPSDTESWVHPALLALLLPLQLDVKVVASESPIPLLREAGELPETAFLDGAVNAIRYLVGSARLTLDDITKDNVGALQRLIAGYFIHTDANAGMGRGGFDYRWQQLPAVARNLASNPLYVFHYLKKWQRRSDVGLDGLPSSKVQQYLAYFNFFNANSTYGGVTMSHARELTTLYRQFYRAGGYKSNAILRPISVAAKAILDADTRLFGEPDALEEVVWGEVQGFINRVRSGSAQGRSPKGVTHKEADPYIRQFAHYFVHEVYVKALKQDAAALRGRQLNLLKNACEVLYLEAQRKERGEAKADEA